MLLLFSTACYAEGQGGLGLLIGGVYIIAISSYTLIVWLITKLVLKLSKSRIAKVPLFLIFFIVSVLALLLNMEIFLFWL